MRTGRTFTPGESPNGNAPRKISPGFIGGLSFGKVVDVLPHIGEVGVPFASHALELLRVRVVDRPAGQYADNLDPPGR